MEEKQSTKQKQVKTVKMTRDAPVFPGGPVSCDVHPKEVGVMRLAGWREA